MFGCPTINIGSRQAGRLRGKNVLDVEYNEDELVTAIYRCFDDEGVQAAVQKNRKSILPG